MSFEDRILGACEPRDSQHLDLLEWEFQSYRRGIGIDEVSGNSGRLQL